MASGGSIKHTFSSLIKQKPPKNNPVRYRGPIVSMRELDTAFQGAGQKAGIEIWRVGKVQPVPVPKSLHGKFFTGDCYLVLKATTLKDDTFNYDLHYWVGKDTSQEEAAAAAAKAIELDAVLGGHTVQYREMQGNETDKFLSYFKPCIIPLHGGSASTFTNDHAEREYVTRLFVCKGRHVVHVKEVQFTRGSLNHDDIFVLDTKFKIFQFNGMNSTIQERARALDVVQHLKDTNHEGKCEVAAVEDGRLMADAEAGEFWAIFGGFAPLPRKTLSEVNGKALSFPTKLLCVSKGQTVTINFDRLTKELLETNKCYLLDSGLEIYVWMGRETSLDDRKQAGAYAEELLRSPIRQRTHVVRTMEGSETVDFRSKFYKWPEKAESNVSEEGKGKVAAFLKRQGLNVKGTSKSSQLKEEPQPYIDCTGNLEVWRVDGNEKISLPSFDHYKLYTGDCYIFRYFYPGEDGEDCVIGTWFGQKSIEDERTASISLVNKMMEAAKNQAVLGHFYEGKEPIQFYVIFQNVLVFKGGLSSGYRKFREDNGITDESYSEQGIALFRVQGSGPDNMQAIQVNLAASSLNSSYCYILHDGDIVYMWIGNLSAKVDQELAERQLDVLKPDIQPKLVKEGSETERFLKLIGGKSEYPSQKIASDQESDPRLFACSLNNGKLKVKEIFNFTQDDLMTEDIFILDCHAYVFIWVGLMVDTKIQAQALSIAENFLKLDALMEKLSLQTPIYIVPERSEPTFFTRFFSWDSAKAVMHGNSFQRKLAIVTNGVKPVYRPKRRPVSGRPGGQEKPQRSRSVSLTPDRVRTRGRSPAFNALAANFENPNARNLSTPPPLAKKTPQQRSLSPGPERTLPKSQAIAALTASFDRPKSTLIPTIVKSSPGSSKSGPEASKQKSESDEKNTLRVSSRIEGEAIPEDAKEGEVEDEEGLLLYPYERLRTNSTNPVKDIDVTRRETYLSSAEFKSLFHMTKSAFSDLPRWKQNRLKIGLHLF